MLALQVQNRRMATNLRGTISLVAAVVDPGLADTETVSWTLIVDGIPSAPAAGPAFSFPMPAAFTTIVVTATATR